MHNIGTMLTTALNKIAVAITRAVDTVVSTVRKLEEGIIPEHNLIVFLDKDGKTVRMTTLSKERVAAVSKTTVRGILAPHVDGQIFVEDGFLNKPTPDYKDEISDTAEWHRMQAISMSGILTKIESRWNIWILPTLPGNTLRIAGRVYRRLLFITRNEETYEVAMDKFLVKVMGTTASDAVKTKIVKSLDYLATPVYPESFRMRLFVTPKDALKNPVSMDGNALHLVRGGNDDVIFKHPAGFTVTRNEVLHLRGIASGNIFKGTSCPVELAQNEDESFRMPTVLKHFKKEWISVVYQALLNGYVVCTPDVLKDAKPGRYNATMYWHNSSSQIDFWQSVKFASSQYLMRKVWISNDGLVANIVKHTTEFCKAMSNIKDLIQYVVKHKEAFDDDELDAMSIKANLEQIVKTDRPWGINFSDNWSLLVTIRKLIKSTLDVHVGTSRMAKWAQEKHLGIGTRAFVMGDPTLTAGQFGIPRFMATRLVKLGIATRNGKILNTAGWYVEARRYPATITSSCPVELVVRGDNFAYFTCPIVDANNYGADWDGDKMEVVLVPEDFAKAKDMRQSVLDAMPAPKFDSAKHCCPSTTGIVDGIPQHHMALFNLQIGDCIGFVHFFIECMGHKLLEKNPALTLEELLRIQNVIEVGPLTSIIDCKKHNPAKVVLLAKMSQLMKQWELHRPGDGWKFIFGKLDLSDVDDTQVKVTVKDLPNFIRKVLADTDVAPQHSVIRVWMDAMLANLPKVVEGAEITEADLAIPTEKAETILRSLLASHKVLLWKAGFSSWTQKVPHNVHLDAVYNDFMKNRRAGMVSSEFQHWYANAKVTAWDKISAHFTTPENQSVIEMAAVAFAVINRNRTQNCASQHGWIFGAVSSATLAHSMKLIFGGESEVS